MVGKLFIWKLSFYEFKQNENSPVSVYVMRCSWSACLNVRNGLLVPSTTNDYSSNDGWSMVTTANENNFIHDGKKYYNLYFKSLEKGKKVILKYSKGHYTGTGNLVKDQETWKVTYSSGSVAIYQFNKIGSQTFVYILECSWTYCYYNRGNYMSPFQFSEAGVTEDWDEVTCFENNCQNKARCHGDEKAYKCRCADGWHGRFCSFKGKISRKTSFRIIFLEI